MRGYKQPRILLSRQAVTAAQALQAQPLELANQLRVIHWLNARKPVVQSDHLGVVSILTLERLGQFLGFASLQRANDGLRAAAEPAYQIKWLFGPDSQERFFR
jgi:hypothetical protein